MRILIAPDAFKGSLTSSEAAAALADGIRSVRPGTDMIIMPLADGGEGTLAVIQSVCGGEVCKGVLYDHQSALIESARLIGLTALTMSDDVLQRGSAPLGKAILAAMDAGVKALRIALGGSATVDGGLGLLLALGCRVLNADGVPVSSDLNGMMQARKIDISGLDQRLEGMQIVILSDVQAVLCGKAGAVYMYGMQKGIAVERLHEIDAAMLAWADLCEQAFALSVQGRSGSVQGRSEAVQGCAGSAQDVAGAGAAGGLGFALQLLGGRVVSGAEYVMQASAFDQCVASMDWVVTGEGLSDAQTLQGKLPLIVAQKARSVGVNVALISGDVANAMLLKREFDAVLAAKGADVPLATAMQDAAYYLSQAAARWAGTV